MAETNKILEVTYGEFSCRLEGFDHPVETMKTVVTYFHALSGHENFMDMRPQAPDPATLARLTKGLTAGTVEVENTADGVSLRLQPLVDTPLAEDEQSDIEATALAGAEDAPENDVEDDVEDDSEIAAEIADDEQAQVAQPETAYGDEIDVADEATADEMTDFEDAAEEAAETDLTDLTGDHGLLAEDENVAETEEEYTYDAPGDEAATEDDREAAEETDNSPLILDTPARDTTVTSVADRLQRLRAVAGRDMTPSSEAYAEDVSEPEAARKAPNPLAQRLAELAKRNSELMDADALAQTPDTLGAAAFDPSFEDEDTAEDEDAGATTALADTTFDDHDVAVTEDASDATGDAQEQAASDLDGTMAEQAGEKVSPTATRPLLLTTRHTKIVDAPDSNEDDDFEDDNDDFDLKAELAEIEREIAKRPGNELARHGLPRSVEDAMSRILNETNEQMNEPEGRRHRDAFAQLKAAVAATEASRQLGDLAKSRDISAQFRDDLGALDAEGKAKGEGLPPLKLVTPIADDQTPPQSPHVREDAREQSKPLDAASERLREIATRVASRDAEENTSFATFAREKGARELADLLEAAAAYIAYVEGDSDFSRPQVMKVVQSASEEEISREDGLRSFGRLLRQSRIIKLNNGRFQVSEDTRFRPDNGRAARG